MQVPDVPGSGEMDVAVIGAETAGLAAARHLAERRPALRVVVLEVADRPGGQAHTVGRPVIGAPLDLRCGWFHGAEHNPWLSIAERLCLHSAFYAGETPGCGLLSGQSDHVQPLSPALVRMLVYAPGCSEPLRGIALGGKRNELSALRLNRRCRQPVGPGSEFIRAKPFAPFSARMFHAHYHHLAATAQSPVTAAGSRS